MPTLFDYSCDDYSIELMEDETITFISENPNIKVTQFDSHFDIDFKSPDDLEKLINMLTEAQEKMDEDYKKECVEKIAKVFERLGFTVKNNNH